MAENENKLKLKKPGRDYLDNRRDLPSVLGEHVSHLAVLAAAPAAVNILTEASVFQLSALGVVAGASALYQAGEVTAVLEKCLPGKTVSDRQLGYRASTYIYRGPGIRMGNAEIREYDAFYYLQLPRLQVPKEAENPAQVQVARDHGLVDIGIYSLNHLADEGKKVDYKAVFVEIPDFDQAQHADDIPGMPDISPSELFENKGVVTNLRGKKVAVLTKEELEKLFEPEEEFSDLARGLDDTTAWELLYIARNATDPEMKQEYGDRFKNRLNQLIIEGVNDSTDSSTSLLNPTQAHGSLRKLPVRRNVLLVKDAAGIPSVQIIEGRSIRIEGLEKLLKIDRKNPLEQEGSRTTKRARIAYLAKEKVEAGKLDDFFELEDPIEIPEKEDILDDLAEEGIKVKKPESIFRRGVMPDFKKFTGQLTSLRSKVSSLKMAGAFYAAVLGLEWFSGVPIKENYDTVFEATFPFLVPPDAREWRVQEHGLDSAGYYALGTSSNYSNGKWEAVTRRVVNLQLPTETAEQNKLTVSRRRFINPFAENSIKLPIKNKTKVAAVDVKKVEGDRIPVHTVGLEDQTVEVIIPYQGFNFPWAWHVDINADLVETPENTVRAVNTREPLDLTKLSPESLDLINLAHANPEAFAQVLTQGIKDSHYYSIDPPGKWSLLWNRSPENRVNAIMELEGGSCIVVAEGLALFLSNDPEKRPSALVVGYPYGIDTPASSPKDGIISRDMSHAWVVLDNEIFDATSGIIGADAKTQALTRQVKRNQGVVPPSPASQAEPQVNESAPPPEPTPEPVPVATATRAPFPTPIFRPVTEVSGSPTATTEPSATAIPTRPPEITPSRTVESPIISDLPPEPSKPWTSDLLTLGILGGAGLGLYFLRRHLNRNPANWVTQGKDGSIMFPLRESRFMIRGVRLNQEELTKAYSFLSAVSFDPFGQYHVPPAENTLAYDKVTRWLAKKPDFNSVVENTDKSWLRAYVRNPEVFDGNAEGLTEREKQKIRQLAKFIVNGGV